MNKTISIFGATGSIGDSCLSLLDELESEYEIEVISGHQNLDKLIAIAQKYRPKLLVLSGREDVENNITIEGVEIQCGQSALIEAASRPVDWVLNAVIGAAGLPVSLAAAAHAKTLALANKESMVAGGALLKAACDMNQTHLIPVDSEHSAIFQSLLGQDREALNRIILTATGGPFRNYSIEEMGKVTLQDALNHPIWKMGARITIDSASMFNKALEMIEAKELFNLDSEQINVIIHPEAIIHSLVEFQDKGQIAQLGLPDMKHAIAFALGFPKRLPMPAPSLNLGEIGQLNFQTPDETRFPALRLAREVMKAGGQYAIALNAAKEIALDRFFAEEIRFLDIAIIVEQVLEKGDWNQDAQSLSEVLEADFAAREQASREQV